MFPIPSSAEEFLRTAESWLFGEVLTIGTLGQAVAVILAFVVARLVAKPLAKWVHSLADGRWTETRVDKIAAVLGPLTLPFLWLTLVWLATVIAAGAKLPHHLITIAVSLITVWIIIRLTSSVIRNPAWAKVISVMAWSVAALNILNLLDPTLALLDGLAFHLGVQRISALTVIKAVLILGLLLWGASTVSRLVEQRIRHVPNLSPSVQVLFAKLTKIVLIAVAILIGLNTVGIDLTALAVFSGAVGVGIGFGLQKVVSNLMSGVILLLDKSIKPGDVIAVSGTYGWISSLGARYVSVVTRDGIEHLIPNEELITQRVENWSFTDQLVRLRVPVGVSYKADVHKAMALCVEAASDVKRVSATREPKCLLRGFGDSSVDLEIRFWISDPSNGVSNVKSEVLLNVWEKFRENDIEIPFPQRDIHIHQADPGMRPSGMDVNGIFENTEQKAKAEEA
ncbi:MAG: mechanosensitive ion channel [Rhodospirillales bacterium]|nr:mechanosensitive ion channel [Rhodospirillales bacterium]MCW8971150.1 mechanosensitive ion channel [Rhodospirillales bacterium]